MKLKLVINDGSEAQKDWPQYRIDTQDGTTVAEVFGDKNVELGNVLAAAPELLDACKLTLMFVEDNPSVSQALRNAINKAEGK